MDYRMAGDYTVQQGDLSYGASDYGSCSESTGLGALQLRLKVKASGSQVQLMNKEADDQTVLTDACFAAALGAHALGCQWRLRSKG